MIQNTPKSSPIMSLGAGNSKNIPVEGQYNQVRVESNPQEKAKGQNENENPFLKLFNNKKPVEINNSDFSEKVKELKKDQEINLADSSLLFTAFMNQPNLTIAPPENKQGTENQVETLIIGQNRIHQKNFQTENLLSTLLPQQMQNMNENLPLIAKNSQTAQINLFQNNESIILPFKENTLEKQDFLAADTSDINIPNSFVDIGSYKQKILQSNSALTNNSQLFVNNKSSINDGLMGFSDLNNEFGISKLEIKFADNKSNLNFFQENGVKFNTVNGVSELEKEFIKLNNRVELLPFKSDTSDKGIINGFFVFKNEGQDNFNNSKNYLGMIINDNNKFINGQNNLIFLPDKNLSGVNYTSEIVPKLKEEVLISDFGNKDVDLGFLEKNKQSDSLNKVNINSILEQINSNLKQKSEPFTIKNIFEYFGDKIKDDINLDGFGKIRNALLSDNNSINLNERNDFLDSSKINLDLELKSKNELAGQTLITKFIEPKTVEENINKVELALPAIERKKADLFQRNSEREQLFSSFFEFDQGATESKTNSEGIKGEEKGILFERAVASSMSSPIVLSETSHSDYSNTLVSAATRRALDLSAQLQARGGGTAKVQIEDEKLGKIELNIQMTKNNTVTMEIKASDNELKNILEKNSETLKKSLDSQNISLADFKVTNLEIKGVQNTLGTMSGQSFSQQQNSNNQQQEFSNQQNLNNQSSFSGNFSNSFMNNGSNKYNVFNEENSWNKSNSNFVNRKNLTLNNVEKNSITNIQRGANGSIKVLV